MKKFFYQAPEVGLLNVSLGQFIAASGNPAGSINELDEAEELPWTY